jgi:hypothetical protein
VSRVSSAPGARVGVGEVAPPLPGTRPRGRGADKPEGEGDCARLSTLVRDRGRTFTGDKPGERAPEADRQLGG